jgi:hypothetical protein
MSSLMTNPQVRGDIMVSIRQCKKGIRESRGAGKSGHGVGVSGVSGGGGGEGVVPFPGCLSMPVTPWLYTACLLHLLG